MSQMIYLMLSSFYFSCCVCFCVPCFKRFQVTPSSGRRGEGGSCFSLTNRMFAIPGWPSKFGLFTWVSSFKWHTYKLIKKINLIYSKWFEENLLLFWFVRLGDWKFDNFCHKLSELWYCHFRFIQGDIKAILNFGNVITKINTKNFPFEKLQIWHISTLPKHSEN